jgi:hypothetical protein
MRTRCKIEFKIDIVRLIRTVEESLQEVASVVRLVYRDPVLRRA